MMPSRSSGSSGSSASSASSGSSRRTEASILHVDLDAFYASVEQRADPTLRGRPVIVGGLGPRGVVAAASYEARAYGVHSALPMARARRLCPDGVFLSPRFDAYTEASQAVMEIFRAFTPLVEPIASDEAFLDVAGSARLHGSGVECATTIRARVRAETQLTASVGVATTKLLAKLASDSAKPDGLLVIEPGTELAYLHPLPVRRLWGVGPATERRLTALGVHTIGELALVDEGALVAAVGEASGHHLFALAWNRDDRPVEPGREVKSIGNEMTFPDDIADRARLGSEIVLLADRVAQRLRGASRAGRTIQLKVRFASFRTITRSRTLPAPTDLAVDIGGVARELLDAVPVAEGVRLLGVSVQQLQVTGASDDRPGNRPDVPSAGVTTQPELFGAESHAALERSVDAVRSRFGDDAVGRLRA
ncbi:MAG: DNA polymerase IV [Acidimicrobiia bacterium]